MSIVLILALIALFAGVFAIDQMEGSDAASTNTFEVSFNANGGSSAPAAETVITSSTSFTFQIRPATPTYTGYAFRGWATSSTATTPTYAPGGNITVTSSNPTVVLYAVWVASSASHTYTLSFDANGGSGGPSAQTSTTLNQYVPITVPGTLPSWSGHRLVGWAESSTATVPTYFGGDIVVMNSSQTTKVLYAVWTTGYTHQITYNGNGGAFYTQSASHNVVMASANSTMTATVSSEIPYSALKQFLGWATSRGTTTISYHPGDSIELSTSSSTAMQSIINLYAVWGDDVYSCTLSFDANNGTGAPSPITHESTTTIVEFTIPSMIPTRTGYEFAGWAQAKVGYTALYQPGDSYSVTVTATSTTVTLYAIWSPYTYVLVYDSNGGSGAPSGETVHSLSSTHQFTVSTGQPVRSGYTFDHWNTRSDDTGTTYTGGDTFTVNGVVNSVVTTTLYAIWEAVPITYTYTLSYNANGGSGAPSSQSSQPTTAVAYGFTVSSVQPTWANHAFMGWNTESDGSGESYSPGDSITLRSTKTSQTLWAVWGLTYTLTYDANGGTISGSDSSTMTESHNSSASSYDFLVTGTTAVKSGYLFMGWAESSTATVPEYHAGDTFTIDSSTLTDILYAVWGRYGYIMTFDANGGSGAPRNLADISNSAQYTFTLPSAVPVNSYANSFKEWNTEADGTGQSYAPNGSYTVSGTAGSWTVRTLHAIWNYTYTLTYNANGGTDAPTQSPVTVNASTYSFTVTDSTPNREGGYTFRGWNTESDGTGTSYSAGGSFTLDATVSKDGLLYAIWTDLYHYEMYFYANGGHFEGTSATLHLEQDSTAATYGWVITQAVTPSRSDGTWEFRGWATSSSATVPEYTWDGADGTLTQYSLSSSSLVGRLWAVWVQGYTYTLNYDLYLSGSSWTEPLTESHDSFNTSYNFTIPIAEPTNPDYGFHGWALTVTGYTTLYQPGDTFTLNLPSGASSVSATLKAIWDPYFYPYTFILVYNSNGGHGAPESDHIYSETATAMFTITDEQPEWDTHRFTGWNTSADGTGTALAAGDSYTVTASSTGVKTFTVFAMWSTLYEYTIAYYPNGGDASTVPESESYTVDYTPYTFTIPDVTPYFQGHTFMGWNTDYTSDVVEYGIGDDLEVEGTAGGTVRTYLYAVWQEGYTYTLTYDANGGTRAPEPDSVTVADESYEFTVTDATPLNLGEPFMGWNTEADGTGQSYAAEDTIELGYAHPTLILYAMWGDVTHWSNGEHNASVGIMFRIDDIAETYGMTWTAPIERFVGTVSDTDSSAVFEDTGYFVQILVTSVPTGPLRSIASVSATLYDPDGETVRTASYEVGAWAEFIVTLNPYKEYVSVTKVNSFRTFQSYTPGETAAVMDWTDAVHYDDSTVSVMDFAYTDHAPLQQVVTTNVFLNTYGIVMKDPTIDIDAYWPNQTNIRVNFFSFALYGDSVTVNGIIFPVTDATITIPYIRQSDKYIYDAGSGNTKTYTFSDLAFTWENGHAYITFNKENIMYDLGEYTERTFQFNGIWYFASGVYDYHVEQVAEIIKDWSEVNFDFTAFGLILAFLLTLAGIYMRLRTRAHGLDYALIIGGILLALVLSGGVLLR